MCYCNCNPCVPLYTEHTNKLEPASWLGAHSAATLDTDANEQLTPSTPATPVAHFRIRKIMPYKSKKYLNVLEKYLENEVLLKCT